MGNKMLVTVAIFNFLILSVLSLSIYTLIKAIVDYEPDTTNVKVFQIAEEKEEQKTKEQINVNLIIIESEDEKEIKEPEYLIEFSDEDVNLMAKVIMSEAGGCSYECKLAVAETIVNRTLDDDFPNNIHDVIYQPNQYYKYSNYETTNDCYKAVYEALKKHNYPDTLFWFRNDYPHKYGHYYMDIDGLYFNTREEMNKR